MHAPDRVRVRNADLRQEAIGEVEREPTLPIRRVYNARRVALQRQRTLQGGGDRAPPQDFPSVRSVMARARKHVMPPIPPTIGDVRIEGPWAETWGSDKFLLHQDEDWGVAVFATKDNLRKLRHCGTVYMDGL